MTTVPLLPPHPVRFPDPQHALDEPDGLLAAGGRLDYEWLSEAYRRGVFPWFDSDDDYILWWSPSQRAVIQPGHMHVTRSLAKRIRNAGFEITMDNRFAEVLAGCRAPRTYAAGTWITQAMTDAYLELHRRGIAHSLEVWQSGQLVGGLYGVSIGAAFFGESMFSRVRDASKVGFYHLQDQLQQWSFDLIDCQMMNPHLATLGVIEIPRDEFLRELQQSVDRHTRLGRWRFGQP